MKPPPRQRPAVSRAVPKSRKWRPALVAAGVGLGLLAGAGWYARQPPRPTLLPGGLVVERLPARIAPRDSHPRSPWSRHLELGQRAEACARANGSNPGELQLWDLADPGQPPTGTRWRTVMLHNPGFAPKTVFEHPAKGAADRLLGFFAADGRPLTVERRRPGNAPDAGMWLLHPVPPLAPGETRPVIQLERLPSPFKDAGRGQWKLRWPGGQGDSRVRLHALRLPKDATWTLQNGTPEPELLDGEPPVLFWLAKPGQPLPTVILTATWPAP